MSGCTGAIHTWCTWLVLKSGDYFFQHCWQCSDSSIAVTNREWRLIEQIWYACMHMHISLTNLRVVLQHRPESYQLQHRAKIVHEATNIVMHVSLTVYLYLLVIMRDQPCFFNLTLFDDLVLQSGPKSLFWILVSN